MTRHTLDDADPRAYCPATAAIELIQEKWVLLIVRALLPGGIGFNELARTAGGCNAATLAQRLERLEALGLLTKEVQSYMPPRTLYTLTEAGRALESVIAAADAWGRAYLSRPPAAASGRDA
jgi:DNA-binding HxlR family transcriptional regulator